MADSKEKLFSDFSPVSTEQWMEKVTADLKGADFEKKLVWKTNEGFKVKPFYRMEDLEGLKTTDALPGEFPYLRGTKKDNNEWLVRQEIKVECPKEANAKALDILNKGVDSLSFHVKAKELNAEYIETLLKDICAECVELNFSTCQGHVVELAELLVAYFQKKDYDLTKLQGSINYDYFNKMLAKGKEKGDMVATAKALLEATASLPKYRVLNVNALTLNNAGSYIFQELGYALAWGNEYMNQLVDAGLPAAMVAKKIKFNFGIRGILTSLIGSFGKRIAHFVDGVRTTDSIFITHLMAEFLTNGGHYVHTYGGYFRPIPSPANTAILKSILIYFFLIHLLFYLS